MKWELYSDGACQPNPGKGGWAFVLTDENNSKYVEQGYQHNATNNRMELLAVLSGVKRFKTVAKSDDMLIVFSDSQYLIDGISRWSVAWSKNKWIKKDGKPVLNDDIWKDIRKECDTIKVVCQYVRGHDGNPRNEEVDKLAVEMIKKHG